MINEIRYTLRGLVRNKAYTAIAVLVLSLGIGANAAIFSVVNAILFRPLPYPEPEKLVVVLERHTQRAGSRAVGPANFADVRDRSRSLASVAAAEAWGPTYTGDGPAEQIPALRVSPEILDVLKTAPALGRGFSSGEAELGRHRVVLLSNGLWRRRFSADPAIVGRKLQLNAEPYEVIGVMPEGFRFPPFWAVRAEMWAPLAFSGERWKDRGGNSLRVFARMEPGADVQQVQIELSTLAKSIAADHPASNSYTGFVVTPLHEMVTGSVRPVLLLLLGAVAFVLLIACANVTSLAIGRGLGRAKEVSVRVALGAGRWQIARQLLIESLVLSLTAGLIGTVLAYWGVDILLYAMTGGAAAAPGLPRLGEVRLDRTALLYTGGIAILTGLLSGLFPALHAWRKSVSETLKASGRAGAGKPAVFARRVLVASEVAFTIALLWGAALMTRSFAQVLAVDAGFQAENVLTADVSLAGSAHSDPQRQLLYYSEVQQRLARLPGVMSVGAINHLPLTGDVWSRVLVTGEDPNPAPADRQAVVYRIVSPGYFTTVGATLLQGRNFNADDGPATPAVAVINDALARRYWAGQNPLGRRVRLGGSETWQTVVGVVRDIKQHEWTKPASPEIYLPYLQQASHFRSPWSSQMSFVVRATGAGEALVNAVRAEIWAIDKNIPISNVMTMERAVSDSMRQPRIYAVVIGGFAGAALVLAALGVYGMIAYSVAQQRREIGIRIALGARESHVLRLVAGEGLAVVGLGIATGLALASLVSGILNKVLFGVSSGDVPALLYACALILITAAAACYLPARRAMRVDPTTTLRSE